MSTIARRPTLRLWPAIQRRNERDAVLTTRPARRRSTASAGMGLPTLALVTTIVALAAWAADGFDVDALAAGATSLASSVAAFIGQAPF